MFRMGGSSGTGITSGLDRPGYANGTPGTTVGGQFFPYGEGDRIAQGALDIINKFPKRMNAGKQPTTDQGSTMLPQIGLNQNRTPSIKQQSREERLLEALGKRDKGEDISKFLINFGLNLASATPRGNIIATAAEAAKGPSSALFDAMDSEKDLERQIKLAAVQGDIAQEEAVQLQMLKNLDKDTRSAIQKQAKEGFDAGLYKSVDEGIRRLLLTKEFGIADRPGEKRQANIDNLVDIAMRQPGIDPVKDEPVIRNQITVVQDYNVISQNNPDTDFAPQSSIIIEENKSDYQPGKVYYSGEQNKFYLFNGPEAEQPFTEIDIKR